MHKSNALCIRGVVCCFDLCRKALTAKGFQGVKAPEQKNYFFVFDQTIEMISGRSLL